MAIMKVTSRRDVRVEIAGAAAKLSAEIVTSRRDVRVEIRSNMDIAGKSGSHLAEM